MVEHNLAEQATPSRPRVIELIKQSLKRPLTTIVAGPGFGKTRALYSAMQDYTGDDWILFWLRLTPRDNSESRFWEHYVRLFTQINDLLGEAIAEIGMPQSDSDYHHAISLILGDIKPEYSYIIIIEDLHYITNEAIRHYILRSSVDCLSFSNIIMASRERIDISPMMLAENEVSVITEDNLRFTYQETEEFLNSLGTELQPGMVDNIYTESGGWAYGIDLVGTLLCQGAATASQIRQALSSSAHQLIEHELFLRFPEDYQRLLIRLTLIDHLAFDLVQKLADNPGLLEQLDKRSSFISYDRYLHAYRMHQLMASFLAQFVDQLSEEEIEDTYRQAARWCQERGYTLEAISYYQKLHDWPAIIDIAIALQLGVDYKTGQLILDVLENTPPEVFEATPAAYILYARALLSLGRIADAAYKCDESIAILEQRELTPQVAEALVWTYNNRGFASILMSLETREYTFSKYFEKAYSYLSYSDPNPINSVVDAGIMPIACLVGSPDAGEPELYVDEVTRTVPFGYQTMSGCLYGTDDLTRAEVAFHRTQMPEAERFAVQAVLKSRDKQQTEIENRALFYLLRIHVYNGKYTACKSVIEQLNELLERSQNPNRFALHNVIMGWYYASIGEMDKVPAWMRSDFLPSEGAAYTSGLEDLAKCRYYAMNHDYLTLLAFIEGSPSLQSLRKILFSRLAILIYQAVSYYHTKNEAAAFAALEEAYEQALPNNLDLRFVEMGNDMRALASAALKSRRCSIPKAWLEAIKSKSTTYAKRLAYIRSQFQSEHNIGVEVQLSSRETEVLVDLSQGLSRSEIALGRGLSVNTVKAMLQSVFNKLGAENSKDAIRIASTMGLLEA
ncbi:MAG: LuxR C-terminal-related transcriptional regulator [Coriobacteriales bacterium]|jgi:LuxR family maltose regulon positive regulatory protein|nr:LuxR C-terminal-related transcriptional regulator [Coriobacteriales bacterium]